VKTNDAATQASLLKGEGKGTGINALYFHYIFQPPSFTDGETCKHWLWDLAPAAVLHYCCFFVLQQLNIVI